MSSIRHLSLFLTESCNLRCAYCYAANMERRQIDEQLARQALELALGPPSGQGARRVAVTFWGGEPLLCFDTLRRLVAHAEELAASRDRQVAFAVPTNATLLTDEMIDFFQAHRVQLSLSLDGDEPAQSLRQLPGGRSSFAVVQQKLELVHRRYGRDLPGVRMTVSPATAGSFYHNVRFFLDQGFTQVYFAPVVEASWPPETLEQLETEAERLGAHWVERLREGGRISFNSWDRLLAWRELRRRGQLPAERQIICGAGTTMLAVDIDGDLYPCHRFVFYDKASRLRSLGHVREGLPAPDRVRPYLQLDQQRLGTPTRRCAECEAAADCRLVCPALNHALCGEIHTVDERICQLAAIDQRVVASVAGALHDEGLYKPYVEDYLMRAYAPGELSASVAALYARLTAADADSLASRADAILTELRQRQRRPRR
jgi:uncharacterized protein